MANSSSISEFKERVVNAIAKDDTLFYAFDAKDCENGGDLIGTHIFKYNKIPKTITEVSTYLTIMVHTKKRGKNGFVTPTLEIWIYSHRNHMKMDHRITKDNRIDYISMLIDDMFNGSTEYGGIGELTLTSNTEGTFNEEFLYRRMIFETIDVGDSFCDQF